MEYILPPSQYIVCSSISHDSLCRARSTELYYYICKRILICFIEICLLPFGRIIKLKRNINQHRAQHRKYAFGIFIHFFVYFQLEQNSIKNC